jgi:hypothetical protein
MFINVYVYKCSNYAYMGFYSIDATFSFFFFSFVYILEMGLSIFHDKHPLLLFFLFFYWIK